MNSVKNVACMLFVAMAVPVIGEGFSVADYVCYAANICLGEPKHEEHSIMTCLVRTWCGCSCIATAIALFYSMKKAREGQQTEQLFASTAPKPLMGKQPPVVMVVGTVGCILLTGIGLRALNASLDC